jgi:hypothetical protein
VLVLFLLAPVVCGQGQPIAIDPHELDSSVGPCTSQTGVAAVNRILWAFNHKSEDVAAQLFSPDSVDVIQPMLEITELGWRATTVDQVRRAVRSEGAIWFRLLGQPDATVSLPTSPRPASTPRSFVLVGPIRWSATGDHPVADSGGKAEVDCDSRTFVRLLL